MSGEIVPFDYSGREIRTLTDLEGAPWWVAADVCSVIGVRNVSSAVRGLDDDEKGSQMVDTPGGRQELLIVNESGLYTLLIRARGTAREAAKPFRRWVTHEVLPSIRRTGQYAAPGADLAPVADSTPAKRDNLELARLLLDELTVQRDAIAAVGRVAVEAKDEAHLANARLDAIEGAHDWLSALAWARWTGKIPTDEKTLNRFGRLASAVGKRLGITPRPVQHAHYGRVNAWPVPVWDEAHQRWAESP